MQMNSSDPAPVRSLTDLPPELILRCLEFCTAQSIVRLSTTCKRLFAIARSEVIWRTICLEIRRFDGGELEGERRSDSDESVPLIRLGGRFYHEDDLVKKKKKKEKEVIRSTRNGKGVEKDREFDLEMDQVSASIDDDDLEDETDDLTSLTECDGDGWWRQASFLIPHSQHLGYWISSTPYTSRIIKLSTSLEETSTSSVPTLTITASQLMPRNAYNSLTFTPAPVIPAGCRRDGRDHAAYLVPRGAPTPDAGLSVDILHPEYDWNDLFTINESSGALLSTTPYSGWSPDRFGQTLRLRLEKVVRDVLRPIGDPHSEQERRRQDADSMLALFTGRAPVRPWPSEELVGSTLHDDGNSVQSTPVRRKGIFRGMNEWLLDRGSPRSVVQEVVDPKSPVSTSVSLPRTATTIGDLAEGSIPFGTSNSSSIPNKRNVVEGFHLQVRRKLTTLPGPFPRSPPRFGSFDDLGRPRSFSSSQGLGFGPANQADPATSPLRRGLRAGPDIIWNGGTQNDPEETGLGIPIPVRAGGGVTGHAGGGFVFHLTQQQTREQGLPSTQRVPRQEQTEEFYGEEIVRTDREEFYPIKAPSGPITGDTLPTLSDDGEILASSLEGLWLGTYGPHGLEFGHVSIRLAATNDMPTIHPDAVVYERRIEFCKVSGDANVPSGQVSWAGHLSPLELVTPPDDSVQLGTVPSVTNETLLRWNSIAWNATTASASSSSSVVMGEDERPRWEQGTVEGWGRVAAPGFSNPGYTAAEVIFIRSSVPIDGSSSEGGLVSDSIVEVVDEIRVRWRALGKTSVFRRVRLPPKKKNK